MKSLITLPLFILMYACSFVSANDSKYVLSNNTIEEVRTVSSFDKVCVGTSMRLHYTQGPQSVRIVADENIIRDISTKVVGGELEVKYTKTMVKIMRNFTIDVYVSSPQISKIDIGTSARCEMGAITTPSLKLIASTSGYIESKGLISTQHLDVDLSTSSRGSLQAETQNASIHTGTSAKLDIEGKADDVRMNMSTSSRVEAENFNIRTLNVDASTSSRATVSVSEQINGAIHTSASVRYKGTPRIDVSVGTSGKIGRL